MKKSVAVLALGISFCFGTVTNVLADCAAGRAAYAKGDFATALSECQPQAEKGDKAAQTMMGNLYAKGQGVAKDEAQATAWFQKAATQGDAEAQTQMGFRYQNGIGVTQDEAQSIDWYRKAAAQGNMGAEVQLGYKYMNGQGVQEDLVEAAKWFNIAIAQGHDNAPKYLARISGKMTPEQLAEAEKLAKEWKPTK